MPGHFFLRVLTLLLILSPLALPSPAADPPPAAAKNRLAKEKSLYLQQHATNPVDWHPWGEEAFALAKQQGKPIFLSIGYSTCHWCHVMEEESFADAEVAKLLNESFICIKVDREERPDVDNLYMTMCQLATGRGGWPLTVLLTPEKRPFYLATYIPKTARFGSPGMKELVPQIAELWKNDRAKIEKIAANLVDEVQKLTISAPGDASLSPDLLPAAYANFVKRFDAEHGGFGSAPKFPTPHNMLFLLRHYHRTGEAAALAMVEQTLEAMRRGGIYDQLGYGFHRYSTDAKWLVPHFEKMLYDQALLMLVYAEAYRITKKPEYKQTVLEIVAYLERDMTTPEGAFRSAEDADSEGEEGKFYVWTRGEFVAAVGAELAPFATSVLSVLAEGNFVDPVHPEAKGSNILHLRQSREAYAAELSITPDEFDARLAAVREKLLAARAKRPRPLCDDKVLVDWNGLAIAALARSSWLIDEPRLATLATRAADFILTKMRADEGRLWHRYRDGEAGLVAHIDDYAALEWGLIELYQATLDVRFWKAALELQTVLDRDFWDDASGGYFFTSTKAETLLFRQKEVYDGATPSGNSLAMFNLVRLGRLTGHADFEARADRLGRAFTKEVAERPWTHTQLLMALDFAIGPSFEVVIAGRTGAADTEAMLAAIRQDYRPHLVLILRRSEQPTPDCVPLAKFTASQLPQGDRATAYVCEKQACRQPTIHIPAMLESLAPSTMSPRGK